jgi:hypothetical protein
MAKFVKGQSGNPGGRPKAVHDLKELARERTLQALETLTQIMESVEAPSAARVQAACALLDRAYGKPVQTTELSGLDGGPITVNLSHKERLQRIAFALRKGMDKPADTIQ